MSISTLQEKFFNKGCGTALIVVAAVAMGASMFSNRMASAEDKPSGDQAGKAVATVEGVPVSTDAIQKGTESMIARMSPGAPPDPMTQAMAAARATGMALQQASLQAIVSKEPVTDAEVIAAVAQAVDGDIERAKGQLVQEGKLKPTATEAELQVALKDALKGKSLAQLRADTPKEVLARFKDPSQKAAVVGQLGGQILVERLGEKAAGDEQTLRDSYKTYVVRRIFLSSTSGSKETPEARAAKALSDLKAGKSFDAEMDGVSNDPAPMGKKIHEATESVPASSLSSRPELASLIGKAPNATTAAVDVPGGKAIYQLVSVKDDLPKDFEANKAKYRAQKIQAAGAAETEKRVKALLAGGAVRWQSLGYQALAATFDATAMGIALDPVATKKAFAAGQAAVKAESAADRRLGAQALLALTDPRVNMGGKTPEATANRLAALSAAAASGIEDASLSLELAGLYGDMKDGAKATDALIAASKGNSDYEAKGQRTFGDIAAKALELQKKGVLTKAQLESVQAQQALWAAQRADSAKAATQAKSDAIREKAENDAEIARQKAEAAKGGGASGDAAAKKANEDEIARQKSEGAKPAGSAPKPTGPGR